MMAMWLGNSQMDGIHICSQKQIQLTHGVVKIKVGWSIVNQNPVPQFVKIYTGDRILYH